MTASAILRLAGKSDRRVVAVFGIAAAACHRAVTHVREGAPEVPVWLFCTEPPMRETAALCERVYVEQSTWSLFLLAQRQLWPVRVALAVAPWTGERGRWAVKLAPFLIPPFRILLLNAHSDLFAGSPGAIALHLWHRLCDAARRAGNATILALIHLSDTPRKVWVRTRDLAGAAALLTCASLLRWLGYPQSRWFGRIHGAEPLALGTVPAGAPDGVVRYVQHKPGWDAAAIAQLARAGTARWLVWQQNASEEPVDDLLPLFEDGRTFAVSRQLYFRAWRASLFPMAPFRTLQPNEFCRVLATVSDTIVVDLAKLAALEMPERCLAGTAWLELFWKAAAAGWICYSGGQPNPLMPLPDRPMESAELFWRVLRRPGLRRLGPQNADLARGTVAFAPALQRPCNGASGKPRVLVVSPFLPYPLSHGGAVRIWNLCRALADRVDFILAAMREQRETVDYTRLHEVFHAVYVVDRDELPSTDDRLPRQVRQYQSRSMRALIAGLAARCQPDVLQIEYTHMADFRSSAPHVPALLVEHDVTFTLYRQLVDAKPGNGEAYREFERWRDFEARWLASYDGVWTVSDEDRAVAAGAGSRPDRTFTIANGVDLERFRPRPEIAERAAEVLYVGSFRHLPNIVGFEKLCEEVMPRVWKRHPELRLRVVAGPEHEKFFRDLGGGRRLRDVDGRITIHGFVEDLTPLYATATAVAVPLEISAGTNIKVLEAMACGKAMVTTPVGCAGLGLRDGHDAAIRENWAGFADALCEVAESGELRARMGERARRTAERRFGWAAIAEKALESYRTVAGCVAVRQ